MFLEELNGQCVDLLDADRERFARIEGLEVVVCILHLNQPCRQARPKASSQHTF